MSAPAPTASAVASTVAVVHPQAGFKACSICARSLHSAAFSATQFKAAAKSRKCTECIISGQDAKTATPSGAAPISEPGFKIVDVIGKGQGIIATRDFEPGDTILEDQPLFTISVTATPQQVQERVQQLPAPSQQTFYALARSAGGVPSGSTLEHDIFTTNMMPLGQGTDQGGLFPLAARLNHSCQFNVYHSWSDNKKRECIIVCRHIKQGDELCTMYSSGHEFAPRDVRQQHVQQHFGFRCECPICHLQGDALAHSDARRKRVVELDDQILQRIREGHNERGIALAEERLKLMEEIGKLEQVRSDTAQARTCYDAYQAAQAMRNLRLMKRWIDRAREHSWVSEGRDPENSTIKKHARLAEQLARGEMPQPECSIM